VLDLQIRIIQIEGHGTLVVITFVNSILHPSADLCDVDIPLNLSVI